MTMLTAIIEELHEFSLCTVKVAILCVFVVVVLPLSNPALHDFWPNLNVKSKVV